LQRHEELKGRLSEDKITKVKALAKIAEGLNCTVSQLAIAWCLKNPYVTSVILGATHPSQLQENLGALQVKRHINEEVHKSIENIFR